VKLEGFANEMRPLADVNFTVKAKQISLKFKTQKFDPASNSKINFLLDFSCCGVFRFLVRLYRFQFNFNNINFWPFEMDL